jgi:sugar phosphate isomerase/epimerase
MPIKQSVCYPVVNINGMPLDTLFGQIAEIGYAAIELLDRSDDFEKAIVTAQKYGLAIASMSGHTSLTDGLNNRANHHRIEAELRESLDIAAE